MAQNFQEILTPSRRHALAVAALVLAALTLRLWGLTAESLWYDEALSVHSVDAPTLMEHLRDTRAHDWTRITPFYYFLQYAWYHGVYPSTVSLRLLSVLLGMLSLGMLYALTRRLFGAPTALVALMLASFSNMHIYYSQEIRVYALLCVLNLLSLYAFIAWRREGGWRWALLYYAATALMLWTHVISAVYLVPAGLYLLHRHGFQTRLLAGWALGHLPGLLALAAWMHSLDFTTMGDDTAYMRPPGWSDLLHGCLWDGAYLPHAWFGGVVCLMALVPLAPLAWRGWKERGSVWLLVLWTLLPPLLVFAVSHVARPIFIMRYWLPSSLTLFVLAGLWAAGLGRRGLRWGVYAGLSAMLVFHAMSEPRPFRPDFSRAAELLRSQKQPGDAALCFPDWEGFFDLMTPELGVDRKNVGNYADLVARIWEEARAGRTVWVVYSLQADTREMRALEWSLTERNLAYERFPLPGGSPTFVYGSLARHTLRHSYATALYRVRNGQTADISRNKPLSTR